MLRCHPIGTAAVLAISLASAGAHDPATTPPGLSAAPLDIRAFHPVEGPTSGPAVYYRVVDEPGGPFLRGSYRPGLESVTMGTEVPEALRQRARRLRWRWRAQAFPNHGDECRPGSGDCVSEERTRIHHRSGWFAP